MMQIGALPKCLQVKIGSYYKSGACTIHMGAPPYPLHALSTHPRLKVLGLAENSPC
jgi:hypothetical protein